MESAVENILLSEWDPIDVADVPEARDEYRSYAILIEKMLSVGCTENDISLALLRFECENMGFDGDVGRASRVAAMIIKSVKY